MVNLKLDRSLPPNDSTRISGHGKQRSRVSPTYHYTQHIKDSELHPATMVRFDVGPSRPPIVLPPDHPPVIGLEQCPVSDSARSKYLSAATASSSSSTPESSNSRYTKKLYDDLSKDRVVSSIPRAPIGLPSVHLGSSEGSGSEDDPNWVYPSEYQFFNAMSRKSHKPKAADMPNVVAIHNAVNEKAWEEVLKWEVGMGSEPCGGPKLVSFAGIPTKRTPRALVNIALG